MRYVRALDGILTSASESKGGLRLRCVEAAGAAVDNEASLTVATQRVLQARAGIRESPFLFGAFFFFHHIRLSLNIKPRGSQVS